MAKKQEIPLAFCTESSINLADDEELTRLVVAAGFDVVLLGLKPPILKAWRSALNFR
jgi:hypothetical protein